MFSSFILSICHKRMFGPYIIQQHVARSHICDGAGDMRCAGDTHKQAALCHHSYPQETLIKLCDIV